MTDTRKDLEKLRGQGINPYDKESFWKSSKPLIGVIVQVMIPETSDVKPLDFNIEVLNKRSASVSLSDFEVHKTSAEQKVLSFVASMVIPKNVIPHLSPLENEIVVTSFADFAWFHGNESVPPDHVPETTTVPTDAKYNDIGWLLPCRFADRLVDALGKANDFLMEGVLENSLLYGPYYMNSVQDKKDNA